MSDERLKKIADPARASRTSQNREVTEKRELSDDDRVEMFRQQFFQSALPDLPPIDGYHTFWATTANPRDTINNRIRLGYEPIKPEDVSGYDYITIKTGEYAGFIGVNEMLALKLPMRLYQAYMTEAHFDAPRREDEKLVAMTEGMREQVERAGGKLIEGDGMQDLRYVPDRPVYTD
jgi:hypothetical protein